ncbi:hypothetical protein D3C85_1318010 [compost metagenome]
MVAALYYGSKVWLRIYLMAQIKSTHLSHARRYSSRWWACLFLMAQKVHSLSQKNFVVSGGGLSVGRVALLIKAMLSAVSRYARFEFVPEPVVEVGIGDA